VARHDVAAVSIGQLLRVTIVRRRSANTPAKQIENAKHTILTFILSFLTFTVSSSILSLNALGSHRLIRLSGAFHFDGE